MLKQQGAHHPGLDGYKLASEPVFYDKGMCPETLDYLARTMYFTPIRRARTKA